VRDLRFREIFGRHERASEDPGLRDRGRRLHRTIREAYAAMGETRLKIRLFGL
jgi:hypothetical protein